MKYWTIAILNTIIPFRFIRNMILRRCSEDTLLAITDRYEKLHHFRWRLILKGLYASEIRTYGNSMDKVLWTFSNIIIIISGIIMLALIVNHDWNCVYFLILMLSLRVHIMVIEWPIKLRMAVSKNSNYQ